MEEIVTYQVKAGPYGHEKEEVYNGPSLLRAYAVHDEIVSEIRLTGPITDISVMRKAQTLKSSTSSYLQITQVGE